MMEQLALCFQKLPVYLGGHMLLSMAALGVGLAVSLPLGILASRRTRLAEFTLGVAGIVQTVPSLALLALMVPLLGGMIGFVPAFIALTLYSILPALSNTITGVRGVDPSLVEAARGLGMNNRQVLFRVQLPLAMPVLIAGIRTAAVLVVGTATLVTPVGGESLGNYIFQGLHTGNQVGVVFGCVATAILAVIIDQFIRLLEIASRTHSRRLAWIGAVGLLMVFGGGLYEPVASAFTPRPQPVVVGSLEFPEQDILAAVIGEQLEAAGFSMKHKPSMAENLQFQALCDGKIDCCVEYLGNIWSREMQRTDSASRDVVFREVMEYLKSRNLVYVGSLGFENAYALAMPEDLAEKLHIRSIADLRPYVQSMKWEIVGDDQIFQPRPEWRSVQEKYGLKFAVERSMDPNLMYGAVGHGNIQVICTYTSDGRNRAKRLRLLEDPKAAFPPYDAMLLVSAQAARRPNLVDALKPLVGKIDLAMMQDANLRVAAEKQSPEKAAAALREAIRH
jgi:osmoprotectant transport system permease protein